VICSDPPPSAVSVVAPPRLVVTVTSLNPIGAPASTPRSTSIRVDDSTVFDSTDTPPPTMPTALELWKLVFAPSISTRMAAPCGSVDGVTSVTAGSTADTAMLVATLVYLVTPSVLVFTSGMAVKVPRVSSASSLNVRTEVSNPSASGVEVPDAEEASRAEVGRQLESWLSDGLENITSSPGRTDSSQAPDSRTDSRSAFGR
jgi:hypothetical protein